MARDQELGLEIAADVRSDVCEEKRPVQQNLFDENLNNIWSRLTADKSSCEVQFAKGIEFRDLVYAVFQGRGMQPKFLLKSISGKFSSGELTAIMGPSGAGKSTLMNVLAGFKTRNVSGQILIDSKPRDHKSFRRLSCFILQDAPLLSQLTVAEAMYCSSQLNLPRRLSSEQRNVVIDEILQVLGLFEAKGTRTSALSGGQRKRLSIAQEMVNNPPIMFFDEPTSGLDSASSLQCIAALQTIARQGRTVICTIHQPSAKVFDMFDQLYFLCDGQCVYRGPVKYLVSYLTSQNLHCPRYHNPSDFLMDIASGDSNEGLSVLLRAVADGRLEEELEKIQRHSPIPGDRYMSSEADSPKSSSIKAQSPLLEADFSRATQVNSSLQHLPLYMNDQPVHAFEISLFHQTSVLFRRTLICIWRDTTLTRLRLLAHVFVGLLIGLLYFNIGNQGSLVINNAAFIFFSVLFIMFSSLMPTVMTFPLEMRVFITEHLNYWYSVRAYYFAKTLADLPFQITFPLIYGIIVYWMTDQPAEFSRFMIFLVVCVQTALVGQSLGLVIGAATELEVAVFLGPATGIPILLFSGFFVTLDAIPKYLQWLSYSSFTRYAFEGAMKGIYGGNRSALNCNKSHRSAVSIPCIEKPQSVLSLLNISNYDFIIDFTVLNIFFILLRILCFVVLYAKAKSST